VVRHRMGTYPQAIVPLWGVTYAIGLLHSCLRLSPTSGCAANDQGEIARFGCYSRPQKKMAKWLWGLALAYFSQFGNEEAEGSRPSDSKELTLFWERPIWVLSWRVPSQPD